MKKSYVCICCPLGCTLEVEIENGRVISVEGNRCPAGRKWIEEELNNPVRTLITVLPVRNGKLSTVSVRSTNPIPLKSIPEILKILSGIVLDAPVRVGEVILHNPLGLNVDIVATREA